MKNIIKSIIKLEYCNISDLSEAKFIKGVGVTSSDDVPFENVCIEPFGSMTVSSETKNNTEIYKTVITARSKNKLPDRADKLAFRVTTVGGDKFIIGKLTTPFPGFVQTDNYPQEITSSHFNDIEISWEDTERPYIVLS